MEQLIKALNFNYTIRRSQRAKKTRIVVTFEKIEVVAPIGVLERDINDFVKANQSWVEATLDKVRQQNKKKPVRIKYTDGVLIPFRGRQTRVCIKKVLSDAVRIEFDREKFTVYLPSLIFDGDNSEIIRLALINWMKAQAHKDMEKYIELYAKKTNLYPRYTRIKTQKSRWGSCGIHNDININWLLILAPPEVMEYVIVHELCHIKERNHSARFWLLVETYFPLYQEKRNWLKQNGMSLTL